MKSLWLLLLLCSVHSFGQDELFRQWKADTTGCYHREMQDSLTAVLERMQPSKRWIKRHLGGQYDRSGDNIFGRQGFSYRSTSCTESGESWDPQIFFIAINKRRYFGCSITVVG